MALEAVFSLLLGSATAARGKPPPLLVSSNVTLLGELFSGREFWHKLGVLSSGNIGVLCGKVQLIN